MTLEPKKTGEWQRDENAELKSMTRRFWIGLALTVPVLILSMGEFVPNLRDLIHSLGRTNVVWAEAISEHPLAAAIVKGAKKRSVVLAAVEAFESVTGQGV